MLVDMGSTETNVNETQTPISAAKQRWRILARAVSGDKSCELQNSKISVRRFQCFGLFQAHPIEEKCSSEADWYKYSSQNFPQLSVNVRHLQNDGTIKPETLLGFNNTGNICIWPSEEVMAYHCLQNLEKFKYPVLVVHADLCEHAQQGKGNCFCEVSDNVYLFPVTLPTRGNTTFLDTIRNKSVIELGGGMTCLAGMAVAVCSEASQVVLTDGNEESVKNLNLMIDDNKEAGCFTNKILSSRLLRWGPEGVTVDLVGSFDCVLCADCFFFDEGRSDLVDLVHSLLVPQGQAIMFAPHRGETLQAFVDLASSKFSVMVSDTYDEYISQLHQRMKAKGSDHYDENIHYPVMVILEKTGPV